jgi:hypothetical protein
MYKDFGQLIRWGMRVAETVAQATAPGGGTFSKA